MRPTSRHRWSTAVQASVSVALAASALAGQQSSLPHRVTDGLADLRNERVLVADPAAGERGRLLLEETARMHGAAAWEGHSTAEVVGVDRWARPGPWWPEQDQRLRLVQLLGTFTSQAHLLDGPARGEIWGLQSWQPYVRSAVDAPPRFPAQPRPVLDFYLPTLHYFNELPFRLRRATTVLDAGTASLGGVDYRLVFASWGDASPHPEADQYVLWINRSTGLIEKAHYTVRAAAELGTVPEEQRAGMRAGAVGTIHFFDYRETQGVLFPFEQVVTIFGPEQAPPDPRDAALHSLHVERVRFDAVPAAELIIDPRLPPPADRKVVVSAPPGGGR